MNKTAPVLAVLFIFLGGLLAVSAINRSTAPFIGALFFGEGVLELKEPNIKPLPEPVQDYYDHLIEKMNESKGGSK